MKIKHLLLTLLTFLSVSLVAAPLPDGPAPADGFTLRLETSIYPNPTTGVFYLDIRTDDLQAYRVKVVNLIGQTVATELVPANTRTRFDLSTKPKGVYFVQVEVGNEQLIRRVIVQ